LSSGEEEDSLEDLGRDAAPVSSISLLQDLKVRRRSEIIVVFGFTFLFAETGQSQDSD